MAKMTVKMKICVKRKTKYHFVLILSHWWWIWSYFFSSVASLPREITEKTMKRYFFSWHYNTYNFSEFIQKQHVTPLKVISNSLSLKKWKNQSCDVITAILMISIAALSRLQFLSDFLPIDILCSSAQDIDWDCKPVFSVNFFNPIWPIK